MIEIAALWENVSKKTGEVYFSGYLGGAKLMVFTNKFKKDGDKQPTLKVYVTEKEKKEDGGRHEPNGRAEYERADNNIGFPSL